MSKCPNRLNRSRLESMAKKRRLHAKIAGDATGTELILSTVGFGINR